jgi:hypothetical protein
MKPQHTAVPARIVGNLDLASLNRSSGAHSLHHCDPQYRFHLGAIGRLDEGRKVWIDGEGVGDGRERFELRDSYLRPLRVWAVLNVCHKVQGGFQAAPASCFVAEYAASEEYGSRGVSQFPS